MNILITGAISQVQECKQELEKMGHIIYFQQFENENLCCAYDWVEGVICNGLFLHHSIEKFVNLRYIQLTSAGYDRVPIDYIKKKGIAIHNARGVYSIPMAEFTISGVLQLYKKTSFFLDNKKEHKWCKNRELCELYGKSVCVIGCGSVGTECAKRFKAFGCKVIGIDIYTRVDCNYDVIYPLEKLDGFLGLVDIVVLTLPLTEENSGFFDKERFNLLKKGTILINISRGIIVNESDLVVALKNKLGGAVLDVFEEEPLRESSTLWDMDNVILTPHNSFVSEGNKDRLFQCIYKNLKDEEKL